MTGRGSLRRSLAIAAAIAACTLSALAAYVGVRPAAAQWREIAWPFPRDGWPAGRAFRCDAALCGGEVELYVRPKIGFCNCDSGVADDEEVDRVADIDLISAHFQAVEPGRTIRISGMSGRIRNYDLRTTYGARAALGIAVAHRCDLMVVAAQGKAVAPVLQRAALDFLGTDAMAGWINAAMLGR